MGELLGELITQFMGEFITQCFTQRMGGSSTQPFSHPAGTRRDYISSKKDSLPRWRQN